MGVAFLGFVLGIYLSYRVQPDVLSNLNWGPFALVALVGVPMIVVLNTLEFQLSARLLERRFSFSQAAEVTIIGSVANMLPLPGGTMVRVAALKAAGAGLGQSTAATFLVFGLWVGIAFVYSGLWIFWLGITTFNLGLMFLAIGAAALGVCVFHSLQLSKNKTVVAQLTAVKLGLVVVDALRIFGCLLALGHVVSFPQASVLAVSSVMGAAVSIVPAGLGIREGVAAMLAPIVALTAASAFLAASLNRIIGLSMMAPVALFLSLSKSRSGPAGS